MVHGGTDPRLRRGAVNQEQLALVATPAATLTHKPIPHVDVINALVETLGFRHIGIHAEQYAVSKDGMKLFGVMELATTFEGCRFALGLRTSNDKSIALGITVGYRVMVCSNLAFHGNYTPVLKKHTRNFDLNAAFSIGVDNIQRNFEPMVKSVELWRGLQLSDVDAKQVIYEAFIKGELEAPKSLARPTHDAYFNPPHEEFQAMTMFSLSNAFTHAFKGLEPIPMQKATASLGEFLKRYNLSPKEGPKVISPGYFTQPGLFLSRLKSILRGVSINSLTLPTYAPTTVSRGNSMNREQLKVAILDEICAIIDEPVVDPYEVRKVIDELFGQLDNDGEVEVGEEDSRQS